MHVTCLQLVHNNHDRAFIKINKQINKKKKRGKKKEKEKRKRKRPLNEIIVFLKFPGHLSITFYCVWYSINFSLQ